MEALSAAFSTALGVIKTDALGLITTAMPIALAIAGIFIAVRIGMRFFKSVAK